MGYVKIVQSGNLLEVYEYEKNISKRKNVYRARNKNSRRVSLFKRRLKANVERSRKSFVRLVRSNLVRDDCPSLLTLTMHKIVSIESAYRDFNYFSRILRRKFGKGFRYIAVPEFQRRGAVHFHALVWGISKELVRPCILSNIFYYDKTGRRKRKHICQSGSGCEREKRVFADLWGHGIVDYVETDGHEKLAGYLGKYMSKSLSDERLKAQKAYVATRNVMRPVVLKDTIGIAFLEEIWGVDNELAVKKQFYHNWLGQCYYKSYILKK